MKEGTFGEGMGKAAKQAALTLGAAIAAQLYPSPTWIFANQSSCQGRNEGQNSSMVQRGFAGGEARLQCGTKRWAPARGSADSIVLKMMRRG